MHGAKIPDDELRLVVGLLFERLMVLMTGSDLLIENES